MTLAEVERELVKLDALAADITIARPRPHVKVYMDGAPDAEATWVGICTLCEARHVTNLDPKKYTTMPDACGEGDRVSCTGTVLLSPDSDALLSAFLIGGYEALRDDTGCGKVVKHDPVETTVSHQRALPGGGRVRETVRIRHAKVTIE